MSSQAALGDNAGDPEKYNGVEDAQRDLRVWPTPRDDEIEQTLHDPESQQREKSLPAPALAKVFSRRSAVSFDPGPAPGKSRYLW